ncbi:hypothetical protein [Nocardia alba]|uniref:Uncharacterized protein n=1 Tax=Nocardia alba TaxID=225051 RepID=A0A4R1G2Z3_9NOCA|nr:hypothetical protein [Nocardia alba]TCK00635.1 hypothetical protein DFR71_1641 [Nocardia alba]
MVFVVAFIVAVVGLLLGGGTGAVLLAITIVLVLFGLVGLGATPEARDERAAAAVRRARRRAPSGQARRARNRRRAGWTAAGSSGTGFAGTGDSGSCGGGS